MQLTIIGFGKMGEALARGMLHAELIAPGELVLADVAVERLGVVTQELDVRVTSDNALAVRDSDVVIFAVKPSLVAPVAREIAAALRPGAIILSIAAGITLRQLAMAFNRADLVLARAMPNTPCLVRAGAIGLSMAAGAGAEATQMVCRLLSAVGMVESVPEAQLDAVTGLSGSGPAYIAVLIEALADGGVLAGLSRHQAERLAAQTVLGTARLILETGQHPAQVKDAVASPGGTTIAGLAALEAGGLRHALIAAVHAAADRARELSGE
ncbi:MAG: Pyrroline-5-carboxylate reductase [bacterium ADurb.Bin429]|nr:MAG: Pyrroline-5-carboxylate reductase [bacterium ADurb.Bin429]